ncbi:hypothetical protein [Leifsonia sp. Leaf264]|uniref:hypothetical protein n=1 Tax=Leifsonia sp. Leaf264 TaxID=1736314 RepID=UPI0006F760F0|nr:hypothetical protein [Leifsonia sp. Leaf264]KQO98274.1 hypothetical protein ASF30_09450 [Leifsonia sp. Leaf264]
MAERMRRVIAERVPKYPEPDAHIYHLLAGPAESDFQPVKCGGGILLGSNTETVPQSLVCRDCLTGTTTIGAA